MKLTFETALVYLKQGKRIRRATWYPGECLFLVHTRAGDYVNRTAGANFVLNDIRANDWEVCE